MVKDKFHINLPLEFGTEPKNDNIQSFMFAKHEQRICNMNDEDEATFIYKYEQCV